MNAVEIEEAISNLADQPFDVDSFPYAFLEAFGNKTTTIQRLRSGSTNVSDVEGGVLQRNNIHISTCQEGEVTATLNALKGSPATARAKARISRQASSTSEASQTFIFLNQICCKQRRNQKQKYNRQ